MTSIETGWRGNMQNFAYHAEELGFIQIRKWEPLKVKVTRSTMCHKMGKDLLEVRRPVRLLL